MAGKHSVLMSPNVMLGDEIGSGVQGGRRPGGGGRAGPRLANSGGINYPYTSVELMEAWESAFPAPSFIRDNLFGNIQTSSTKAVAVDYWKESQKLAPWVSPISMGRVVVRDKYKTAMWEPPKLAPIRTMHPEDLFDKAFGEAIGGYDDQGREALYVSQDMMTLDHLIARTEEKMCCEAVTSGSVTCYTIEGAEKLPIAQLDYEIQPQVVVAPDWSDPTTSDPAG